MLVALTEITGWEKQHIRKSRYVANLVSTDAGKVIASACCGKAKAFLAPGTDYFSQGAIFSLAQISLTDWRSRVTANFFPLTRTSAANARVL